MKKIPRWNVWLFFAFLAYFAERDKTGGNLLIKLEDIRVFICFYYFERKSGGICHCSSASKNLPNLTELILSKLQFSWYMYKFSKSYLLCKFVSSGS